MPPTSLSHLNHFFRQERESVILVRALDRFYKKLSAATRNLPGLDTCQASLNVVLAVTEACVDATATNMEAELRENVLAARQAIAAPRTRLPPPAAEGAVGGAAAAAPAGAAAVTSGINLIEMVNSLQDQIVDSLKTALGRLKM